MSNKSEPLAKRLHDIADELRERADRGAPASIAMMSAIFHIAGLADAVEQCPSDFLEPVNHG